MSLSGWTEDEYGQHFDEQGRFRSGRRPLVGIDPAPKLARHIAALESAYHLEDDPETARDFLGEALDSLNEAIMGCGYFGEQYFHERGIYDWAHRWRKRLREAAESLERREIGELLALAAGLLHGRDWSAEMERRREAASRGNPDTPFHGELDAFRGGRR